MDTTVPPANLLDPPRFRRLAMDALSDLLRVVRLNGGIFLDGARVPDGRRIGGEGDGFVTVVTPATSRAVNMADNAGAAYGELPDQAMRARMIAFVDSLPA